LKLRNAVDAINRDRCLSERPVQSTALVGRVPEIEQFGDAVHCRGLAVFETDTESFQAGFRQAADRQSPGRVPDRKRHDRFLSEIRTR
jgi:hypothetical protein